MRRQRFLGSVIGSALLCALPISPCVQHDGSISFEVDHAKAADMAATVHRKARRHAPVVVAEAAPVDPRYLAYCTGNNGGGWNGGTYRGGIFMDLNCYGYIAGDRTGEYRGWGLWGPFMWW